ncbi:MAG: tetratricopeptide repeat protein [Phycisphaeraceae bacterium]
MSRAAKTSAWVIMLAVAAGAMIYFAVRPPVGTAASTSSSAMTWDATTTQYIADQHSKAALAMQHADFTQVRVILQPLLAKYPADAAGRTLLARALMAQGDWRAAYTEAKQSCRIDDHQAEAQMLAGIMAERFDELPAARQHYERASELEPGSVQCSLYLANVCLKLKDYPNADLYALRVLRLDPSRAIAYAITAQVAAEQGQIDRAIEQWRKALLHTQPDSAELLAYTMQEVMLLRRRDIAGREEAINVLLSLPESQIADNRRVTEELAQTYLSLSRPSDASDTWWRWLKNHPTDGPAAAEAGLSAQRAGQTDRARQFLAHAQKIAPDHPLTAALRQTINDGGSRE